MKRILLFAIGVFFGVSTNAQNIEKTPSEPIEKMSVTEFKVNSQLVTSRPSRASRAAVDVVWEEDFANGFPVGWVLSGANANDCAWKHSKTASKGAFTSGAIINSATSANGFLISDVDSANNTLYGQPASTNYQELETYFTTSAIDLTGNPFVRLEFEQYFEFIGAPDLTVSVSTDNVNWKDYSAQGNVSENETPNNPTKFSVDVSNEIGGSATAYIKIGWSSLSYCWMIDDMKIVAVPNNDLTIEENFFATKSDTGITHYYTAIPVSQVADEKIKFSAKVVNSGALDQPNTLLKNTITTPTGAGNTVVESVKENQEARTTDTLEIVDEFVFEDGVGSYSFTLSTSSDSTDFNINDNTKEPIVINVTDSTYARDINAKGNIWYGLGQSFEIGPTFTIYNTVKATSVSIGVGDQSAPGEVISIYIYDSKMNQISVREFVTLEAKHIGALATYSVPEVLLTPGTYLVTFKTYTDKVTYPRSSYKADLGTVYSRNTRTGTWLLPDIVPVVRLNVSTNLWICDLSVTASQTANNTAVSTVTGGTTPYTYLWSNGETTETATGLVSGQQPGSLNTVTVTDDNGCEAKATVNIITAIIETGIEGDISLYPNPNNGEFQLNLNNVESGMYNVSVKNIIGQNIYQNVINVAGAYDGNVKISNIKKGVYFMEILNNKGSKSTIRFVVR